jgi:UDP-N-acetylglucosamine--N-acetylmuramyl-(pentapeptide) pyrophosphoryl-undecaprenol N-acetylglucosamine transferase
VICRAGASTLAEVTAFGRASILIPYPYAAANHQVHNAQALEERGAAVVELESEPDRLWEKVEKILGDRELRTKMADAARSMGHPNSAIEIVTQIAQEMAS